VLSPPVRRGTPVAAFCLGLIIGGVLTATALVVVGSLIRAPLPVPARWALVVAAAGVLGLRAARVLRFRLPENRRLVPETVLRLGRHLGPLQFGVEMGSGVRTYLPSALPYVAAVAVLLLASPLAGVAAGAGFGLGRALMTVSHLRYDGEGGWSGRWRRRQRALAVTTALTFAIALTTLAFPG
jgi:hypothetical protein